MEHPTNPLPTSRVDPWQLIGVIISVIGIIISILSLPDATRVAAIIISAIGLMVCAVILWRARASFSRPNTPHQPSPLPFAPKVPSATRHQKSPLLPAVKETIKRRFLGAAIIIAILTLLEGSILSWGLFNLFNPLGNVLGYALQLFGVGILILLIDLIRRLFIVVLNNIFRIQDISLWTFVLLIVVWVAIILPYVTSPGLKDAPIFVAIWIFLVFIEIEVALIFVMTGVVALVKRFVK